VPVRRALADHGKAFSSQRNFASALRDFDEAIALCTRVISPPAKPAPQPLPPHLARQGRPGGVVVISGVQSSLVDEINQNDLPKLMCHRAMALFRLGHLQEALEASQKAASLKPSALRPSCLEAVALRAMQREGDARRALARFERNLQEPLVVRMQEATLRHFNLFLNADAATASKCYVHQPPPCQPPLEPPPSRPLRPCAAGDSILLGAFEVEDLRHELLRVMSLASKRAAACACASLCCQVAVHLHAHTLSVRIEDATFDNAAFVGRLPNLRRLHVQGETSLPDGLNLAHLRTLDRITINKLGFESALFLGAAISGGYHSLRLSNGSCVLLPPLRTRERINLYSRELRDSDLAALLGALSLNTCLKELNISGNPAPVGNGLRAAMVQALPWHLLRSQPAIRITSLLQACTEPNTPF